MKIEILYKNGSQRILDNVTEFIVEKEYVTIGALGQFESVKKNEFASLMYEGIQSIPFKIIGE